MSAGGVGAMSDSVMLMAPFAGWVLALDQVPDPVFAEQMMGDGIAIEPLEDLLRSPCDGEVISVADTGHSITLRTPNGAELLIHIGLETVALKGEGFSPLVDMGDRVRTGDGLIRFDIEAVARVATSLITPIVVASSGYLVKPVAVDQRVSAGDPLLELRQSGAIEETTVSSGERVEARTTIPMAHGLHARPSAKLAATVKPFQADVRLFAYGREANARSMVALLTLGLKQGDEVSIRGTGSDAAAAVAAVRALIDSGIGEGASGTTARADSQAASAPLTEKSGASFTGICAAPGFVVGPVAQLQISELAVPEEGSGVEAEEASLRAALAALSGELGNSALERDGGIQAAHRDMLADPELVGSANALIRQGKSAAYAWRSAIQEQSAAIRSTGNALLIERADDLLDIERQVIGKLLGREAAAQDIAEGALLVADTLLPSQFLALKKHRLGGIVTAQGGPTSHVAILAASAGIPMLVAAGSGVLAVPDGRTAILDAQQGSFNADASEGELTNARSRLQQDIQSRSEIATAAGLDCVMADGTRIDIFANIASLDDAERAVGLGAEGCGLLRTEFLFLDRPNAPSEEEQKTVYAKIAAALQGRPLIVRTLDIGGDKPVPYIPFPHEDNPALGRRGVRLSLAQPDLLATQLRAVLASVPPAQCRIMVPMIVDIEELRAVRAIFDQAAEEVGLQERVPLGIMVETPSAALLADSLAQEADFLSIGTNDLSQYALAVDRGNQAVAGKVDALHPAVLRLISEAAKGAAARKRWLGVCGSLASDPNAAAVLIGLGATELSAVPAAVAQVKARIRTLTMDHCRELAGRALTAGTAQEVRAMLESAA